ncbi:MAG: glycosyltransferase [Geobacteraceae bacterium]|nr:glycosyltransferase [Geobacteraceae bacterium]
MPSSVSNAEFPANSLPMFPRQVLDGALTIAMSAHGNQATTLKALTALFLSVEGDYELILVDDCSEDQTLELFCKAADYHPNTKIFSFEKNMEYSGSLNAILSHANGKYILFLSNDIIVSPTYIYKLLEVAQYSEEFGIVRGCSNFVDNGSPEHNIVSDTALESYEQIFSFAEQVNRQQGDEIAFDTFLTGDAFLISRKVIDAIGTLDPFFYGYFTDHDLGLRAQKANFKLVLARGAFAVHCQDANLDYLSDSERTAKTNLRWKRVYENWARFKIKYGLPVEQTYEGVRLIPWKKIVGALTAENVFQEPGCYYSSLLAAPDGDFSSLGMNLANRAMVLRRQHRLTDSERLCHWGLKRYPEHALVLIGASVIKLSQGQVNEAIAGLQSVVKNNPQNFKAHSNLLMAMNYSEQCSQEDIFVESLKWEPSHGIQNCENSSKDVVINRQERLSDRRIRIGFVSSDFRTHSVSYFFEPLLKYIDNDTFETYCYSDVEKPDAVTERLKSIAKHWIEIRNREDTDVIEEIHLDQIDILVDLAGHTGGNRLRVFSGRAAPIQVTWLGYPNTTGLATIDYRLTDEIADPVGADDRVHSESLIRLKNGFLCYQPLESSPEICPLACVTNGYITFGSFNNISKIAPTVFSVWARILRRVKNSRLLLKCHNFADQATTERFIKNFADFGITSDRIDLRPMIADPIEHLAVYHEIDIALDTFPYNGTTTTFETLWMGVPVITLSGKRHAARVGASILTHIGLPELIASSSCEYIDLAVGLASDLERLDNLHVSLRQILADSPLCDAQLFAKEVGSVLESMVSSRMTV